LPAVLFEANAKVDDVVVFASLLVCCTRVIAASVRDKNKERRRTAPMRAVFKARSRALRSP
jgi:hypothetical protein